MPNPRNYPDIITSAESGRPLYRGIKTLTIQIDGIIHSYEQPGWWASLSDPDDTEGQIIDADNLAHGESLRRLGWKRRTNEAV